MPIEISRAQPSVEELDFTRTDEPYHNARLDPKNYLEGPLSPNPATRLRQLLARPGIIVRSSQLIEK